VKSLCNFPKVLATMSDKLSETAELGNVFLEQRDEVMNTVQRLRDKAKAEGNLQSNDKQKVVVEGGDIIINPPQPDVVYVPTYDPCLVYGPWWYPTCSPPWFWYPHLVVGVGLRFGPGIFIGPIGGWCGFYWHRHRLFVNVNKMLFFHRPGISRMHGGVEIWRHNPYHRRGYAYFGRETRRRFGPIHRPGKEARHVFRGFSKKGSVSARRGQPESLGRSGPEIRQRRQVPASPSHGSRQSGRSNVFEGIGRSGNEIRHFSERGHESMRHSRGKGQSRGSFHRGGKHR